MLYTETVTIGGRQYRRTYSDTHKIARDGVEYDEAVDPIDAELIYTETDTPLEDIESAEADSNKEIIDILTGAAE